MLVTSIFFFSHNNFYSSQHKFQSLSSSILWSATTLNLDWFKILSSGKEFTAGRVKVALLQIFIKKNVNCCIKGDDHSHYTCKSNILEILDNPSLVKMLSLW